MQDFLDQIRAANQANLFYVALMSALALPDICGALESPDGRATAQRRRANRDSVWWEGIMKKTFFLLFLFLVWSVAVLGQQKPVVRPSDREVERRKADMKVDLPKIEISPAQEREMQRLGRISGEGCWKNDEDWPSASKWEQPDSWDWKVIEPLATAESVYWKQELNTEGRPSLPWPINSCAGEAELYLFLRKDTQVAIGGSTNSLMQIVNVLVGGVYAQRTVVPVYHLLVVHARTGEVLFNRRSESASALMGNLFEKVQSVVKHTEKEKRK